MEIKPQDILFLLIFLPLCYFRRQQWFVIAGLLAFLLAMPLFSLQVFFTAQRLVWYAAVFVIAAIVLCLYKLYKSKEKS